MLWQEGQAKPWRLLMSLGKYLFGHAFEYPQFVKDETPLYR